MIYLLVVITILFIIYSEVSVGSILLRPDSTGKIGVNISSLLSFMIHPLYKKDLWTLNTLDINYPFVMIFSSFIYFLV